MKRKQWVKLSNGALISPFTVNTILGVSGLARFPLLYNPLYWIFVIVIIITRTTRHTKSATFSRRSGNVIDWKPWTFFKFVKKIGKDGMVNCFDMTNPGVRISSIYNKIAACFGGTLIINYYVDFRPGLQTAIEQAVKAVHTYLRRLGKNFLVFEINASCPNSGDSITENMKNILALLRILIPLCHSLGIAMLVKLSPEHPYSFAKKALALGVDGFIATNTGTWKMVMGEKKSPLVKYGKGDGGVSGGPLLNLAYQYSKGLREALGPDVLIICGGGILSIADIDLFLKIGGKIVVTACTWTRYDLWAEIKAIWRYNH
jgi:dihydroorotate dehydrogenase